MGDGTAGGSPPVLGYVRAETRSELTILRDGGTTRLIAPRKSWLTILLDWRWLVPVCCAAYLVAALDGRGVSLVRGAVALVVGPWVVGYQCYTVWRRRVFEVTPTEVRVGYVRGANPIWEERWPRRAVGEVRVNRFEGRLLIRITGQALKEYRLSGDRKATEAAAAALQEALTSSPAA